MGGAAPGRRRLGQEGQLARRPRACAASARKATCRWGLRLFGADVWLEDSGTLRQGRRARRRTVRVDQSRARPRGLLDAARAQNILVRPRWSWATRAAGSAAPCVRDSPRAACTTCFGGRPAIHDIAPEFVNFCCPESSTEFTRSRNWTRVSAGRSRKEPRSRSRRAVGSPAALRRTRRVQRSLAVRCSACKPTSTPSCYPCFF